MIKKDFLFGSPTSGTLRHVSRVFLWIIRDCIRSSNLGTRIFLENKILNVYNFFSIKVFEKTKKRGHICDFQ